MFWQDMEVALCNSEVNKILESIVRKSKLNKKKQEKSRRNWFLIFPLKYYKGIPFCPVAICKILSSLYDLHHYNSSLNICLTFFFLKVTWQRVVKLLLFGTLVILFCCIVCNKQDVTQCHSVMNYFIDWSK